ncbi:MAG: TspO/MBR family protein [Patescibacteria group bacterium]|mgnify:FL=1
MKWSYIITPLITAAIALLGGIFTEQGLSWYGTLIKPMWTPNGAFISVIWIIIYALTTIFALYIWNTLPRGGAGCVACLIVGLLLFNAALNVSWSYIFFGMQSPGFAIFVLIMLELTNIAILYFGWQQVGAVAFLMVPYVVWVAIAGILNYRILILN